MADKTVSVKLTANTSGYVSGIKGAEDATKRLGDTGGTNFAKLGGQMHDVGQKMTLGVTLPIIGAGAAAVKLSNDFDSAFGQMVGLAGVPADEVERLKAAVLDLAGETAVAPQELAEGLYFAASAGLDAAQAMDAVTIAARASAAGMGSTQDVVGLAASAVASYGAANITSAEAVDILTASIREGRAEPAELAGSLGRVLPIAASLGVGLEEVGGTVAYLSNIFGDTDRTVTSVNDAFAKLAAPTDGARAALDAAGTSADELHRVIADDGLLAGLQLLRDHGFAGNSAAIRELMPDMQGAAALTALLNDESGSLSETLGAVADSAGSLDAAYGAIDEDAKAMRQSWVDIQVALIEVGEVIGPIIADIASGAADAAGTFAEMPGPVQKLVLAFLALVAVAGPLLMVTGSIMRNFQTMKTTMVGSSGLVGAVAGVTTVIVIATAAYSAYAARKEEAIARTNELVSALKAEAGGQEDATAELIAGEFAGKEYADAMDLAGLSVADMVRVAKGETVPAFERLRETLDNGGTALFRLTEGSAATEAELRALVRSGERWESSMVDAVAETERMSAALSEGERTAQMYTEVADAMRAAHEAATTAAEQQASAFDGNTAALDLLSGGFVSATIDIKATTSAADRLAWEIDSAAKAFMRLRDELSDRSSYLDVQEELQNTGTHVMDLYAQFNEGTITQAELNRELERTLIADKNAVLDYMEQIGDVPTSVMTDVQALIDQGKYDEAMAMLDALERERIIRVRIDTGQIRVNVPIGGGQIVVDGRRAEGGPVRAGGFYEVMEGDRSELLEQNGRRFLMSAHDGHVTPIGAGADLGGLVPMGGGSASSTVGTMTAVYETHHHYHTYEVVDDRDHDGRAERRTRGQW